MACALQVTPTERTTPDVIQICPWFLEYAMAQDAQFPSQFDTGKMGAMISKLKLDKLITRLFYTPIDLFQLFEKILLHEVRTRLGDHSAGHG